MAAAKGTNFGNHSSLSFHISHWNLQVCQWPNLYPTKQPKPLTSSKRIDRFIPLNRITQLWFVLVVFVRRGVYFVPPFLLFPLFVSLLFSPQSTMARTKKLASGVNPRDKEKPSQEGNQRWAWLLCFFVLLTPWWDWRQLDVSKSFLISFWSYHSPYRSAFVDTPQNLTDFGTVIVLFLSALLPEKGLKQPQNYSFSGLFLLWLHKVWPIRTWNSPKKMGLS